MDQRILKYGSDPLEIVRLVSEAFKSSGIIIYPTETVYGIGADPFDDRVIDKVLKLKGRDNKFSIAFNEIEEALKIVNISDEMIKLCHQFMPGPLTLIANNINDPKKTTGIRVPNNKIAREIINFTGPIISTSANKTGEQTPDNIMDIWKIFGEDINLYIQGKEPLNGSPSTIIASEGPLVKLIREGSITQMQLEKAGAVFG